MRFGWGDVGHMAGAPIDPNSPHGWTGGWIGRSKQLIDQYIDPLTPITPTPNKHIKTHRHELLFLEARLDEHTATLLREDGLDCVIAFVNDDLSAPVIDMLVEAVRALYVFLCQFEL